MVLKIKLLKNFQQYQKCHHLFYGMSQSILRHNIRLLHLQSKYISLLLRQFNFQFSLSSCVYEINHIHHTYTDRVSDFPCSSDVSIYTNSIVDSDTSSSSFPNFPSCVPIPVILVKTVSFLTLRFQDVIAVVGNTKKCNIICR